MAVEVPDAGADFLHQVLVVRDQEHRALVLLQRDVQRVDRLEIEVVGRLVEDEHVRLLQHDAAEQQPRGLAARQRLGRLQPFLAGEQHLAEQAVDVLARRVRIELVQPLDRGHALAGSRRCGPAGSSRSTPRGPSGSCRRRGRRATASTPGASASSAFSSVVLPTPLRPTSTIFSPRLTIALKSSTTCRSPKRLGDALALDAPCVPDGRFIVNLMYGRWMFERASSVVCSRSTSLRRDVHLAGARAGREARDEVVQLRDLLLALRVLGLDARADLRLGQHHVVVAAGVGDDRLVVDVGDVRADARSGSGDRAR